MQQPVDSLHKSESALSVDFGLAAEQDDDGDLDLVGEREGARRSLLADVFNVNTLRRNVDRIGGDRVLPRRTLGICLASLLGALALLVAVAVLLAGKPLNLSPISSHGSHVLLWNGTIVIGHVADGIRATALSADARGRVVWHDAGLSAGERLLALEAIRNSAEVIYDLHGALVLPGFHDSHVHPLQGGNELLHCQLNSASSIPSLLRMIAACVAIAPQDKLWFVAYGWDRSLFVDGIGDKALLDAISPKPMLIWAADGHGAWASSSALAAANITSSTPDPPAGVIVRYAGTSEPCGTLLEGAAELVESVVPRRTPRDSYEALLAGLAWANRHGITSVLESRATEDYAEAYLSACGAGTLSARVSVSLSWAGIESDGNTDWDSPQSVERHASYLDELRTHYNRGCDPNKLSFDGIKLFADGVMESRTAFLVSPYLDPSTKQPTEWRGEPSYTDEQLERIVAAADARHMQTHIHAVGDGAVRQGLNAIEAAVRRNGRWIRRRPHIAHLELIDPQDYARFAQLGVTANWQPDWFINDTFVALLTEPIIGTERTQRLYPIRSIAQTSARMACGSDWGVSSINPLEGMQHAILRATDRTQAPLNADQAMALLDMVECYTHGGAFLVGREALTGKLDIGLALDVAVLDRDFLTDRTLMPLDATVVMTLIDGHLVYRDDRFGAS